MEGESGDFQDWELLNHSSGSALVHSDFEDATVEAEAEASMDGDSEGMIKTDYFSIDSHERYDKIAPRRDASEEGSVESDNPSWIDPGSENRYGRKNSGEFWSDSSSDRSDERKFGDLDGKHELGTVETVEVKSQLGDDGIGGELGAGDSNSGVFESGGYNLGAKSELGLVGNDKSDVGFEGFGEIQNQDMDLGRFWAGSGDGLVSMKLGDVDVSKLSEVGSNMESRGEEYSENESEDGAIVEIKSDAKPVGVGENRRVVWWRVPLEFLKFCAFRVSPVWSFSVAAALMGFIILGRRLSRMKKKTQSLQLKVTVDEKKVSLFKSRAARLNEAFSVVRRVPIIRPSHPAAGLNSWPVMSLR